MVLLRGADETAAQHVLTRLKSVFDHPFRLRRQFVSMHLSIGLLTLGPELRTAEQALAEADAAMYQVKQGLAGAAHRQPRDPHLERDLRKAVEIQALTVHYQPIKDQATGATVAVEALVRWQRGKAWVPPGDFLPLAEQCDLMRDIDLFVFRQACKLARDWWAVEALAPVVHVNLSNTTLRSYDLPAKLRTILKHTGAPAGALVIEISEAVAAEPTVVMALAEALAPSQVRLYLDDFGKGFSSLSMLRELPLDGFKIDASFTWQVHTQQGRALMAALASIGTALRLQVIVEGVETPAQAEVLTHMGCSVQQGFYHARPQPIPAVGHEMSLS